MFIHQNTLNKTERKFQKSIHQKENDSEMNSLSKQTVRICKH